MKLYEIAIFGNCRLIGVLSIIKENITHVPPPTQQNPAITPPTTTAMLTMIDVARQQHLVLYGHLLSGSVTDYFNHILSISVFIKNCF